MNGFHPNGPPETRGSDTRRAFVVWITREASATDDAPALEGRLEDVDTGREFKFQSAGQLIEALERCLGADPRPREGRVDGRRRDARRANPEVTG